MEKIGNVLVVGGGIAGIQASLDLADRGFTVYLVEKTPSIGGRMAQLDKTFPTMDCSICILAPKMIDCFRHPNINLLTYSEVKKVTGESGNFSVNILKKSRFVDAEKCVGCGICAEKCPGRVTPNEFDMRWGGRKAVYVPFPQSVPLIYTIDKDNCLYFTKGICKVCEKFCPSKAIDFNQQDEEIKVDVGAILIATGYDVFDPSSIKEYGYGRYMNVVTSIELERLLSASGPTSGKLTRPSDNKIPHKIAFIQCVGSRSLQENNYLYCSSVCCMYATKEAALIKEHERKSEVYILYTDIRAFGKGFQQFINRAQKEWNIKYFRGKPGEIREDPETKDLKIKFEDTLTGDMKELKVELVVLSTALVPASDVQQLSRTLGIQLDEYGYFKSQHPLISTSSTTKPGIFLCGCCQGPKDIPDSIAQAKGAAASAVESMIRARS